MLLTPFQRAIHQAYMFAPDGDGASGGASGDGATTTAANTGATAATSTTAADGPAATSTAAAASDAPSPPSLNKQIRDFAAAEGITVEKLLEDYKTLRDSTKTETQKATDDAARAIKRAEAAELALRDATGKSAVLTEATKLNSIEPLAVYSLAKDHLQFDAAGNVTNLAAAVAKVKEVAPKLFAASGGSGDGAATTTGGNADTPMNTIIADQLFGRRR